MKKYLILTVAVIIFQSGFSQIPFFITPPDIYITESGYSGNCIETLSGLPTGTFEVANAFWDETYTLRFYVVNNQIYNFSGTIVET